MKYSGRDVKHNSNLVKFISLSVDLPIDSRQFTVLPTHRVPWKDWSIKNSLLFCTFATTDWTAFPYLSPSVYILFGSFQRNKL